MMLEAIGAFGPLFRQATTQLRNRAPLSAVVSARAQRPEIFDRDIQVAQLRGQLGDALCASKDAAPELGVQPLLIDEHRSSQPAGTGAQPVPVLRTSPLARLFLRRGEVLE